MADFVSERKFAEQSIQRERMRVACRLTGWRVGLLDVSIMAVKDSSTLGSVTFPVFQDLAQLQRQSLLAVYFLACFFSSSQQHRSARSREL